MLFTFDCEIVSRLLPCVLNSLHRDWLLDGLGIEKSDQHSALLLTSFLVRIHLHGSVCVPIRLGILQVSVDVTAQQSAVHCY